MKGRRLGEILLTLGFATPEQVDSGLEHARAWRCQLGQALVQIGFAEQADILRALGVQMGAPVIELTKVTILPEILQLVPESIALSGRVLPLRVLHNAHGRPTLIVAVAFPGCRALEEVEFRTGMRISAVLASDADLSAALVRAYRLEVTPEREVFLGDGPGLEHVVAGYFDFAT